MQAQKLFNLYPLLCKGLLCRRTGAWLRPRMSTHAH